MDKGNIVKTGAKTEYSSEITEFLLKRSKMIGDGILEAMAKFRLFNDEIEDWVNIESDGFQPEFAIAFNIYHATRRAALMQLVAEGTISEKTCELITYNSHSVNLSVPSIQRIQQTTQTTNKLDEEDMRKIVESLSSEKGSGF